MATKFLTHTVKIPFAPPSPIHFSTSTVDFLPRKKKKSFIYFFSRKSMDLHTSSFRFKVKGSKDPVSCQPVVLVLVEIGMSDISIWTDFKKK